VRLATVVVDAHPQRELDEARPVPGLRVHEEAHCLPQDAAVGYAVVVVQVDVSSAVPEDTRTMAKKDLTAKTEGGDVSARPRRIKRGSIRVTGPEWAN
jgi:hypothetical protein